MSTYDEVIDVATRKSFFYPAGEMYSNSPAGFWDYGPYGRALKERIIQSWRKQFVQKEEMLEIDGAQILQEEVYKGSGHIPGFTDPLAKCSKCNKIERADKLIEEKTEIHMQEGLANEVFDELLKKHKITCPKCKGLFLPVTRHSLMIETKVASNSEKKTFLRPETCQNIFLNFPRMVKTMRLTLPQGIAQVGKAFRNEISPRQSILRGREFYQMESEVFFDPKEINNVENFDEVKDYKLRFLLNGKKEIEDLSVKDAVTKKIVSGRLIGYYLARTQQLMESFGISKKEMRFREVEKDERPFYSLGTWDFEVKTSVGWMELIANNYRTDYDLKNHMKTSKTDIQYTTKDGRKIIPHVWETSIGVDRTLYTIFEQSYKKEAERIVLQFKPHLAPIQVAIFPLVNKEDLPRRAKEIVKALKEDFEVFYDDTGSIGKRYRRMDEIGCPFMITIDFDTLKDNTVTLRDRDSMEQIRIPIKNISQMLKELITSKKEFKAIK